MRPLELSKEVSRGRARGEGRIVIADGGVATVTDEDNATVADDNVATVDFGETDTAVGGVVVTVAVADREATLPLGDINA